MPGTPENPTIPDRYTWSNRDPAPPWRYSYILRGLGFPNDNVMQIRRVRGQSTYRSSDAPLFGGVVTNMGYNECVPFEVGTDRYDAAGTLLEKTWGFPPLSEMTITTGGSGYKGGDYVTLDQTGGDVLYGHAAVLEIVEVGGPGNVLDAQVVEGGTFLAWLDAVPYSQKATTGVGTGLTVSGTLIQHNFIEKIILTNAQNPIIDFTTSDIALIEYDASFADAFMLAFEGKLALALLGDKAMAQAKFQQANAALIDARVRDGNEGLTIMDHVPDWLQVRGVSAMDHRGEWFNPPYGPLFAV
jgi:hypothetical protein